MKDKIIEGLSWNSISAMVIAIVSFIYSIITARLIGPELIGEIIVYISIVELISTISNFSFGNTIIQNNDISSNKLMGTGLCLSIFTSIIFLFIGGVYTVYFIKDSFKLYFIILLIFKSFAIIGSVFDAAIKKDFKFKRESKLRITINIKALVLSVILILNDFPIAAIVLNYGFKQMIVLFLFFFLPSKYKHFSFDKSLIKIFIKNGKYLFVSSSIARLRDYIDKYIINFFVNPSKIAIYSKGQGLSRIIPNLILTVVRSIFLSTFSNYQTQVDKTKFIIKNSAILLIRLNIFVSISLAICSTEVVYILLGNAWIDSALIMKIGVISAIIYPLITFQRMILLGNGEYSVTTKISVVDFLSYIIFMLIGSKYFGVIGLVMGINISSIIVLLITNKSILYKFNISIFEGSKSFIMFNFIIYYLILKFNVLFQFNIFLSVFIKMSIYVSLVVIYILCFDRKNLNVLTLIKDLKSKKQ